MRALIFLACALALSACHGTMVDVEFFASPGFTASRLLVEARAQDGKQLYSETFAPDGGVSLPTSLRLLVEQPSVDVTGTAIDALGKIHTQTGSVTDLRAGGTSPLRLDLSAASWCPAPPPEGNEQVGFGDSYAAGWSGYGFMGGVSALERTVDGRACSGKSQLRYLVTEQFDGFGFSFPAAELRQVSLRVKVDRAQSAIVHLHNSAEPGMGGSWVLPTPQQCTVTIPGPCLLTLEPGWQRLQLDVPAEVTAVIVMQVQLYGLVTSGFEVLVDDVRLTPR